MGLIKAGAGAVGSVFSDQWKELVLRQEKGLIK